MRRTFIEIAMSLAFLVAASWCETAIADDENEKPSDGEDGSASAAADSADTSAGEEPDAEPAAAEPAATPAPPAAEQEADEQLARDTNIGFLHQPLAATRAGRRIVISGKTSRKWMAKRLVLVARRGDEGEWQEIEFKRSAKGSAVAEIPAQLVEAPGVDYYVYLKPREDGGATQALFASREEPYRVIVHGFSKQSRYESRLAEWDGRISRIELNYGYSSFGKNRQRVTTTPPATPSPTGEPEYEHTERGNYFHEVNIAYTYRFLNYLYAMRVEVAGLAHDFADFKPFTASKDEEIGPGMYAISPTLEFEFAKYFGASLLMRLGISEDGFEGGGGTSLRFGRIKSTRLDLGFEGMSHAGWRLFLRFEWDTVPYLPMAFNLERTQWYAASEYAVEDWGNRMFYEIKALLPAGIGLRVHAGFAARDEAVKGGLVIGGGAWVDF